jgi:hypothetical protein
MKDLNLMIDDARAWAAAHPGEGRPDAWRPDLTPYVRSTATNLELYDKKWSSLRDEYNELVGECVELSERVQAKRDQLERDNGVADSVGELAQVSTTKPQRTSFTREL